MQPQPNFESVKRLFYQFFIDSNKANMAVSMESLFTQPLPAWHKRKEEFEKEFNQWLDRLDIRQAGTLIKIMKEQKRQFPKLPKWMSSFNYYIDYNKYEALDLIIIHKD